MLSLDITKITMSPYKIDSYFNILGKSDEYARLFASAHRLHENQLLFKKLIPEQLAPHCTIGQISAGILVILVENGAIASKLKQIAPSLLLKLQQHGWKVTSFQILVQAKHMAGDPKQLATCGSKNKNIKLSQTGQNCLTQLAASLPNSELRDAIQSFAKKHRSN